MGFLWYVQAVLLTTARARVCVTGNTIDRITVYCTSAQELQEWLDNLQPFSKGGSPAGTIAKVANTHTLQTDVSKHETYNMLKCENFDSKHCTYLTMCTLSHTDHRGQALEHGRWPHSPVSPGQLQCPQSGALGASKDQQTLVSELPTARTPP